MAEPSEPEMVKLICGMISSRPELFDQVAERMARNFGPVDIPSEVMDFDFTHYYDEQMGSPLYRRFVAFERLIVPDGLASTKCLTNDIEAEFATELPCGPARPINIDPGYLESSKLVLGSMKNFSHRIYLARGVYAEVTLMYHKNRWESLGWTFPDYASGRYDSFLSAARDRLTEQLSQGHLQEPKT